MPSQGGFWRGFGVVALGTLIGIAWQLIMVRLSDLGEFVRTLLGVGFLLLVALPLAIGAYQLSRPRDETTAPYRNGVKVGMFVFGVLPIVVVVWALWEFTNGFRAF